MLCSNRYLKQSLVPDVGYCCNKKITYMVLALEPGRVWTVSEVTISKNWKSNEQIVIRG